MDKIIDKINRECPANLARKAISAYIDIREITENFIPDPEVYIKNDQEIFIWWEINSDQPNREKFQISVDIDSMNRDRPDIPLCLSYNDYSKEFGLGYHNLEDTQSYTSIVKHLAKMYPDFKDSLPEDYFDESETLPEKSL